MSMSAALDIAFILIVLASVAIGAGRGAIRAVSGLAGTLAGLVGATRLQGVVAPLVAKIITPFVRASVQRAAEAHGLESILDGPITQDVLRGVGQLMEALGLGGEAGAMIQREAQAVGARVLDAVTNGLVAQLAPAIAMLALFLAIKMAVRLLLGLLSWEKLPVISTLNKLMGAVLGLISGLIIVCILCWGLLSLATDSGGGPLTREHVRDSATGSALVRILDSAV